MHEKVRMFCEILDELKETHAKKSHDYATDIDPHSNFMSADEWGVEPWVGVMLRLQDKVKRLQTYAKKGKLLNEAAEDSFRDIGSVTSRDYPQVSDNNKPKLLHRVVYETFVGKIPFGFQVHHICRIKCCLNWEHMKAMSCSEHRFIHAYREKKTRYAKRR